jgi:iron(III) transport system ATP-binding protein
MPRCLGGRGPANAFTGWMTERRYQGMRTICDLDFGGQKVEVLALGTAARHNDGKGAATLPPDTS